MLAVNNSINSSLAYSLTHLELLLTVSLNYTKVISICLLYIPPNPDHKYSYIRFDRVLKFTTS